MGGRITDRHDRRLRLGAGCVLDLQVPEVSLAAAFAAVEDLPDT